MILISKCCDEHNCLKFTNTVYNFKPSLHRGDRWEISEREKKINKNWPNLSMIFQLAPSSDLPVISTIVTVSSKFWLGPENTCSIVAKEAISKRTFKDRPKSAQRSHQSLSDLSVDVSFIRPGSRDGCELCEGMMSVRWKTNSERLRRMLLRDHRETIFYSWLLNLHWEIRERFRGDGKRGTGVINIVANLSMYHSVCRLSEV